VRRAQGKVYTPEKDRFLEEVRDAAVDVVPLGGGE